jgi:lipoate-protein ligase A
VGKSKFSNIRLLETGYNSAAFNMAVDEVLMSGLASSSSSSSKNHQTRDKMRVMMNDTDTTSDAREKKRTATKKEGDEEEKLQRYPSPAAEAVLRIYGWKPPAVSIGYFQSMDLEVDVHECRKRGIDLVRRLTGGGAVYHEAELTYSFLTNTFSSDIMQSYISICNPVVQAIRKLGFDARFAPLNDIVIGNGVKVSGNAQTRKMNVLLQHGTILLDVNVERMFSVLKVPSEKIKDKLIDDVKKRVSGINRSFDEVAQVLKKSFSEAFDAELHSDKLTVEEYSKVYSFIKEKFSSESWNWRR